MSTKTSQGRAKYLILALGTFLVGMYFGNDLPAGIDIITLQAGMIGILAFLSMAQVRQLGWIGNIAARSLDHVEKRLQRFVDNQGRVHRIDEAEESPVPAPLSDAKRVIKTADSINL